MLLALLACVAPNSSPTETAPPVHQEPACQPDPAPTESAVAWDEAGPGGAAAADALGFAVGVHEAPLAWDDGATDTATLTVTPGAVTQTVTGPQASCPVGLRADITWALTTARGRIAADGAATWTVEDAAWPPAAVSVGATLSGDALGVDRLNGDSTVYLRAYLTRDGGLASLVVEEVWPLDPERDRVCVRVAEDPAQVVCHDVTEGTGD